MHIVYGPHVCKLSEAPSENIANLLRDILSYEPKNANQFIPRGNRPWYTMDPKRYLYHRGTKAFPTGLIPRVMEVLGGLKIQGYPTTAPQPSTWHIPHPDIKPRYYQEQAWKHLTEAGRGVAILPTGTGKTLLAAMLASSYSKSKILVTTPNKRLLHQNRNEMSGFLGKSVGILGDSEKDLSTNILVATIQSLVSRINNEDKEVIEWIKDCSVWICDESHGAAADSYKDLSKQLENCSIRFGVTATWLREDGCELVMEGVLGNVLYEYTYDEAFNDGYLTPIRVWMRHVFHENARRFARKPQYTNYYSENIVNNTSRNLQICLDASSLIDAKMTPLLVLVTRKDHGKILANMLNCEFVNGEDTTKKVDKILVDFMAGKFPVLVASNILNVGVNLKELRAAINAAAGDSRIDALQKPGRGLRLHESKSHFDYIDYLDREPNFFQGHASNRSFTYKISFPGRVKEVKIESIPHAIQGEITHGADTETKKRDSNT
jgi:superfamily II DNA or RNA helicase